MEDKCEWKDGKFISCCYLKKYFKEGDNSGNLSLVLIKGLGVDGIKTPIACPFCGADVRKPKADPLYSDFLEKFIEALSIDSKTPVEILKKKFSSDDVKWIGSGRPSIDPAKNIDCVKCDNPNSEECRICLETFESNRNVGVNPGIDFEELYHNQIKLSAKVFTQSVNLKSQNSEMKKLFIETYKEAIELKKSVSLLKSREINLLKKIKELKEPYNAKNGK